MKQVAEQDAERARFVVLKAEQVRWGGVCFAEGGGVAVQDKGTSGGINGGGGGVHQQAWCWWRGGGSNVSK